MEMFGVPFQQHNSFQISTIGKECILKSGHTLPTSMETQEGELAYIKVADMNLEANTYSITTSTKFIPPEFAKKMVFPKGSVIFPKRGGAIGTNKKRLTEIPICADLNVMGVIPQSNILSNYLFYYFKLIDLSKLNDGSIVPQINNSDISHLPIALPSLEMQKSFSLYAQKSKCMFLKSHKQIKDIYYLKLALMQKFFKI